jgi:hypothetical protein
MLGNNVNFLCHVRYYGLDFGQTQVIGLVFGGFYKKLKFILKVLSCFETQFGPHIGFQNFNYL